MGSPANAKSGPEKAVTLRAPTLAEKIDLLGTGKTLSRTLDCEDWPIVLEKIKEILQPLVQWLDVQLAKEYPFHYPPLPEKFKKKRGLLIFLSENRASISAVALERNGDWFVKIEETYATFDTNSLAKILTNKTEQLCKACLNEEMLEFVKTDEILLSLARHRSILWFMEQSSRLITEQFKERQERMEIMKGRTGLFTEFGKSLDPVLSRGIKSKIPGYSLFTHHDDRPGCSRHSADYLTEEAIKPIWEDTKRFDPKYQKTFKLHQTDYGISSMSDFTGRLGIMLREICQTARNGHVDAKSLSGMCERLPLTKKELSFIKHFVRSMRAVK